MSKHKPAKGDSRRAQLRAAQIAEAKRKKNQKIVFGVVGGLVALMLIAGIVYAVVQFNKSQKASAPPSATAKLDGMTVYGNDAKQGAPVVKLYFDYQCPACKQFEDRYGSALEDLGKGGDIRLEYHNMFFLDTNLRNDASERAANAAMCADKVGAYLKYHDTVFANQPKSEGQGYTDDQLTGQFVQAAGITGDQAQTFKACYAAREYKGYVNKMDQSAGKDGVTGTPTVKVNGKDLDTKKLTGDPASLKTEIMALAK